jgi:hypothetical protein
MFRPIWPSSNAIVRKHLYSFGLIFKEKFNILRRSFKTVLHIRRCPVAFHIEEVFLCFGLVVKDLRIAYS